MREQIPGLPQTGPISTSRYFLGGNISRMESKYLILRPEIHHSLLVNEVFKSVNRYLQLILAVVSLMNQVSVERKTVFI